MMRDNAQIVVFFVNATSFQGLHEAYDYLSKVSGLYQPQGTIIILFNPSVIQEGVSTGRVEVPPNSVFQPAPKSVKGDPMRNGICDAFNNLYRERFPTQKIFWGFHETSSDHPITSLVTDSLRELTNTIMKNQLLDIVQWT